MFVDSVVMSWRLKFACNPLQQDARIVEPGYLKLVGGAASEKKNPYFKLIFCEQFAHNFSIKIQ